MQTGYPSSPYLLRPFSEPELDGYYGAERRRRYAFNQKLSSIRIYIEHVFGLLKSRFQSLRQLGRHEDIKQAYRVIQALMVIHNLCIDFGDQPMDGGDDTQGNVTQEEDITQEDILGYCQETRTPVIFFPIFSLWTLSFFSYLPLHFPSTYCLIDSILPLPLCSSWPVL